MALLAVRLTPIVTTQLSIHPLSVVLPALFDRLAAPTYALVLWSALLFAQDPHVHSRVVWHLFVVSTFSTIHEYLYVTGPSLVLDGQHHSPYPIELYSLSLTVLTMVTTGSVRTGPKVFRERQRLYTSAVTNKLKEAGEAVEPNVISSGDSIIGGFMSTSTFRLMRQVAVCDQVDVHELPVVPASMQTEPTTINLDPPIEDSSPRSGHIVDLVYQIVRSNLVLFLKRESYVILRPKSLILLDDLCVLLEILLAYVPHFCLQQILAILDGGVSRSGALAYSGLWVVAWSLETVLRINRKYD